jgi:hypothetical protein
MVVVHAVSLESITSFLPNSRCDRVMPVSTDTMSKGTALGAGSPKLRMFAGIKSGTSEK